MTLPRQEVVPGFAAELEAFANLVASLSEEEMRTPSRCEGWTVADIAAHVTGQLTDVLAGRFDRLGNPEGVQSVVDERKGRIAAELADELRTAAATGQQLLGTFDDEAWAGPGPTDLTPSLGFGVEGLWYDAYVHAEDIRAAIGRPSEGGAGLRAAVHHLGGLLTDRGWGPATLALDGIEKIAIGSGDGQIVDGDPQAFVLVATGRQDAATLGLDDKVNVYA